MGDTAAGANDRRSSRKRRSSIPDTANNRKKSQIEEDKHALFTQWSQSRGVQIHNVKPASLPGRGIGLRTTAKIKQDERVLFVPEKAMFKPNTKLVTASKGPTTSSMSPQAQLAISIMQECQNSESQYQLWKSTWPTHSDFKASMPLFWSSKLQSHLPPSVHLPLDRQKADYEKDFQSFKDSNPALSSEEFDYFWAIVNCP